MVDEPNTDEGIVQHVAEQAKQILDRIVVASADTLLVQRLVEDGKKEIDRIIADDRARLASAYAARV